MSITGKTCPTCGAEYEVEWTHMPMRDKDSFDCRTCGEELDSWNASTFPIYRLVKPGKKPDA